MLLQWARVIEKHFTLDKNYSDFRDHQLSIDPTDLKELVTHIRELERMLGSGEKVPQPNELVMQEALGDQQRRTRPKKRKSGLRIRLDLGASREWVTWEHRDNLLGKKLNRDCKYAYLIRMRI